MKNMTVYFFFLFFFSQGDDDEIPQELLLGKHQLNELGSESAKIKAMGIMDKVHLHSLYLFLIIQFHHTCKKCVHCDDISIPSLEHVTYCEQ